MKTYYDSDADLSLLSDKKIAIVGYGSQGRAQALNLRDSGMHVRVALAPDSASIGKATAEKMEVTTVAVAAHWADIVMLLAPDELQADIYAKEIAPHIRPGASLAFAHGFSVHFGFITPREDVDVWMVAPKDIGPMVRIQYENGEGVAGFFAVQQNATGQAKQLALAYASAIGCGKKGVMETSFADECVVDLFGEQAVLFGGLPPLARMAFETLVEAGYEPEMAYFKCVQQVYLVADMMVKRGLAAMSEAISNTAEYGGYIAAPRLITAETRKEMKRLLDDIQSGKFARDWMHENKTGGANFKAMRAKEAAHPIEEPGKKLREQLYNR